MASKKYKRGTPQKRPVPGVTEHELAAFVPSDFPFKPHASGRWQFMSLQKQYLGLSTGQSLHEAASLDQFWRCVLFIYLIIYLFIHLFIHLSIYLFYLFDFFDFFVLTFSNMFYLILFELFAIFIIFDITCYHVGSCWPNLSNLSMFISILISYIPAGPMVLKFSFGN